MDVLGCSQPEVERAFNEMLARLSGEGEGPEAGQGMLVAGEFGSGKSHLLGYLERQALSQNFICSRVVISKETPLFDMDKVYRAVVENGRVPGVTGQMVEEIAQKLEPDTHGYTQFFRWANRDDNGLHRILPATLMVHERDNDPELLNRINWFLVGGTHRPQAGAGRAEAREPAAELSLPGPRWPATCRRRSSALSWS